MKLFKTMYLVLSENRANEMRIIENLINEYYPAVIITKFFDLAEPLELLQCSGIMAPDYIFIEDLYITNTYSTLRKICRLEKISETKVVIFGAETDNLNTDRLRNCKVGIMKIFDYANIDLKIFEMLSKEILRCTKANNRKYRTTTNLPITEAFLTYIDYSKIIRILS